MVDYAAIADEAQAHPDAETAFQAMLGQTTVKAHALRRIDARDVYNAVDDTNPTELEDGYYVFDITAAESNGDLISMHPESSTANVEVIGVPGAVYTTPANFPDTTIDSNGRMDISLIEGVDATDQINAACDTALTDYDAVVPADLPTNFSDLSITATTGRVDVAAVAGTAQTAGDIPALITTVDTVVDGIQTDLDNGTDGLGALKTTLDAIEADTQDLQTQIGTDGAGLTNIPWNSSWDAEVESEVDDALVALGLDHLIDQSVSGADITNDSIIAQLVSASPTADWDDFDNTSDSLQALRDRGDAAWTTGGGGSLTQLLNVQPVLPISVDLADTATVRIGLILLNGLDDLPTTGEITPGTISIERKAIGGTSWSAVVTDAAMTEQAGMVYYDEVFDSGTGYAEGDSIRVTFKSVSITADANTFEVCDANGIMLQTEIRQTMRGTDSANTVTPPTAVENRQEMDSNSTVLAAIETDTQDIQSRLPAALVGGRIDSNMGAISGSASAADNLEASALTIVTGTVTGTPTTTEFADSALGSFDNDNFIGRIVIFRDNNLQYQATDITDSDGTAKTFTVTALTQAPSVGDAYVIL